MIPATGAKQQRLQSLTRRGVAPAAALLLAGIVYSLGSTVAAIVLKPAPAPAPEESPSLAAESSAVPGVAVAQAAEQIVARHLFGEAQDPAPAAVASPKPVLRASQLALELHGVFIASEADQSAAIIAERGGVTLRYAVGDSLPGDAVLAAVESDRVILRRGGVAESLAFPKSVSTLQSVVPPVDEAEQADLDAMFAVDDGEFTEADEAELQAELAEMYRQKLAARAGQAEH